ncbi:MAG: SecDF P1 head subdomain-containing protein [Ginsengibacter sp.]
MRRMIYFFIFFGIHATLFSQAKTSDGIYLVDQSVKGHVTSQPNIEVIQFNPSFLKVNPVFMEDEPEADKPVAIVTDDFVHLELDDVPVIQNQKNGENVLFVHLTKNATEKLKAFTSKNVMNNIAVVVNGQVLSIYKITQQVEGRLIQIARCSGNGCEEVYKRLKGTAKNI